MAQTEADGAVTLSDVAAHAGVSLATASRVLHGAVGRSVGEAFRDRVLRAAEELGYTPNAQAQAVAKGASTLVGLVLHEISDPYFSAIAAGVTEAAEELGTTVVLASTGQQRERELKYLRTLRAHRARAVVLVGSRWDDEEYHGRFVQEIEAYRRLGGRVAAVSQNRMGIDTVQPLNRGGARELARQLVTAGHRSFAILAGPRQLLTVRDRVTGFREGLREQGIEGEVAVVRGAFTRDGGYEAACALLRGGTAPECVFAVNDVMAVGAMAAVRDNGLTVPDDVAIAGFDDIETLRDVTPALSTVALPLRDMGRQAAAMALTPQEGGPKLIRVRGEVILRDSTRRA